MKGEQGNFARHHDEGPSHEDSRHREGASLSFKAQAKPQSPEADLREYLTDLLHEPALRRNYEEMFERRLVYNKNQLRAMVEREASFLAKGAGRGPARAEALSASGLDFNGKLRVIQAAFKTKFSRLDAKWSSGGQNLAALVRPVSLRKTERDYELEGENLSTGRPVTIRVGSMTYVGLKKGYYLGEK